MVCVSSVPQGTRQNPAFCLLPDRSGRLASALCRGFVLPVQYDGVLQQPQESSEVSEIAHIAVSREETVPPNTQQEIRISFMISFPKIRFFCVY